MKRKSKYNYREVYEFAKQFGKKAAIETYGASETLVSQIVLIGDAVLSDRPVSKSAKTIDQFTPRELMQELANRGYEGKLTYKQVVDIQNF